MQKLNGLPACSIYKQSEEELAQNVPSHWNLYFTVGSVDETVEAIKGNGGQIVFGPMDVFEAGRMARCQDPQEAYFAIWQANQHIGCRVKEETGAMFWNELLTTDRSAAVDFYVAVLGVERGEVMQPHEYAMLQAGGVNVAGVMQITPDMGEFPPHWTVYFGVDSADDAVVKAQSMGATVFVPPTDIVPVRGPASHRQVRVTCGPAGRGVQHFPAHGLTAETTSEVAAGRIAALTSSKFCL